MKKKSAIFVRGAAIAVGAGGLLYLLYNSEAARRARADAALHAAGSAIVKSIADVMGCAAPPLTISRIVPNAGANAFGIAINPDWLQAAMTAVCDAGACQYELAVGVLAHEVAHFVYGDAFAPRAHKYAIELRADRFAGTAAARIGISADAFAEIVWRISEHHSDAPEGYPSRYERVATIRDAYETECVLIAQYHAGQMAALRYYGLAA